MPVIEARQWRIDYTDDGDGRPVVLIHSAVSGNRQWRRLTEDLKDHRRVLAINLFGYGETSPWPAGRVQSMEDQAGLVAALCDTLDGPVDLLGHSLGGAVALKAAIGLGGRVSKMALFEPNPFHLLRTEGKDDGYAEARALSDFVHQFGGPGRVGGGREILYRLLDRRGHLGGDGRAPPRDVPEDAVQQCRGVGCGDRGHHPARCLARPGDGNPDCLGREHPALDHRPRRHIPRGLSGMARCRDRRCRAHGGRCSSPSW